MTRSTAALAGAALLVSLAACGGGADEAAVDSVGTDSPSAAAPAPAAPATEMDADAMLDPDGATRDQIAAIPGMTPAAADALVGGRPYADMRAVDAVLANHLGEPQRDTVYMRLWKPLDLNTATDEEILLIPNLGQRMLREFKEYRPYRAMEQFRREMGKYVDSTEVARLERYVRIGQ
jgi:DNA uptake protein ComE-like DNA-binding protein